MDKQHKSDEITSVFNILSLAEKPMSLDELSTETELPRRRLSNVVALLLQAEFIQSLDTGPLSKRRFEVTAERRLGEEAVHAFKLLIAGARDSAREEKVASASDLSGVAHHSASAKTYPDLRFMVEQRLLQLAVRGNIEARNLFALHHINQIVRYARRHAKGGDIEDIIQECLIGLLADVSKMKVSSSSSLSKSVAFSIRRFRVNYEIKHGRTIRVPDYMLKIWRQLEIADSYFRDNNISPNITDLKEITGLTEKQIESALEMRRILDVQSLDEPISPDSEATAIELVAADEPLPADSATKSEERLKLIERMFQTLSDRSRLILQLRFGFYDGECKTLEEVGAILPELLASDRTTNKSPKALTRQAVSNIERRAIRRLKKRFGSESNSL